MYMLRRNEKNNNNNSLFYSFHFIYYVNLKNHVKRVTNG